MPVGFCTAEGVGSNPIGSTLKCADLQVKCEGSVDTTELVRGLVLQPILQRAFKLRAKTPCVMGEDVRSLPRVRWRISHRRLTIL